MKIILTILLLLSSIGCFAQSEIICAFPQIDLYSEKLETLADGSIVFNKPDTMPQFKGGEQELMNFISSNLKYPATNDCIQGRVILKLIIRENGNISDIQVISSLEKNFDKEAVRVIKSMPKWIPAKLDGKNIDSYFTLPIHFRLDK